MSGYTLRLVHDDLKPNAEVTPALLAVNRVIFVARGQASVMSGGGSQTLATNQAWYGAGVATVAAGPAGATLWRWELVKDAADAGMASGNGVASTPKLTETVEIDPAGEYLMRCDRVDFPLGGVAFTHTHQGPGTRCLFMGEFDVTVDGHTKHIMPGEPWFEAGPDPVYAEASKGELTAFIRVMILPARLKGLSSIRYVRDEDKEKPKTQKYTMFVDEPIKV